MSIRLESHWFISRVYSTAMGANLIKLFFNHYDRNPRLFEGSICDVEELKKMRGRKMRLIEVDGVMVSKIGGPSGIGLWPFDGAKQYYNWASCKHVIEGIKRYAVSELMELFAGLILVDRC